MNFKILAPGNTYLFWASARYQYNLRILTKWHVSQEMRLYNKLKTLSKPR
jgi:hypothetical protein